MIYRDRRDAGRRLAREFAHYEKDEPVVLALPRGGVMVAAEIAKTLHAPLDLVLVRKIGAPFQPELAMGAIVDGSHPHIIRNDDIIASAGIAEQACKQACQAELAEIDRRRKLYLADRPRSQLE